MSKALSEKKDRSGKRDAYLKKLRKLGEELTALRDQHRKREKKFAKKLSSYEEKLKRIDDKLGL
jgi:predicted  nucleic acid-binding Zn-ribbon protein